ncbi:MAG: permease, partial [Kiritimatiellae bacterium]|nr:permease [Kiritimatiellia bacterium]
ALIPADLFSGSLGASPWLFPVITLLAIPMYVCSTGSIPVALALIHVGVSPGAALVFLIAGPATNAAAVSTLWKIVGRRTVLIYLASIVATAWLSGFLFNAFLTDVVTEAVQHHAATDSSGFWNHFWAILLVLVLGNALWPRKKTTETKGACSCESHK